MMAKYDFAIDKKAKDLLTELKFDEVRTHVCLSKSQTIEQLDMVQCEVELINENEAQTKQVVAVTTISTGSYFNID